MPPQDLEAEQSVLGACLIDAQVIPQVRQLVDAEDFYSDRHRLIFEVICRLHDQREPVDPVTIQNALGDRVEEIGGLTYLTNLINAVPTTANAPAYARIVADKATLRRLQRAARRIIDECYGEITADDAKALAASEIQQAVYGRHTSSIVRPFGEDLLAYIEQSQNDEAEGKANRDVVPTIFRRQDDVMPLMRGEVTVVPSPSSMGKTTYMFNLLQGTARMGEPSIGFSLEMSRPQILQKMWANLARINTLQIRRRALSDYEWARSMEAAAQLLEVPLFYALKPRMRWADIRVECLAFKAKHGKLSLVAVDYWQILGDAPRKDERDDQKLGRLVEEAKALAVEADCHVVILAQAKIDSRKVIPELEDVKDSRAIVAAADNVLFLTRPLEFGEQTIKLPSMDGSRVIEVKCNATDPTIHGKRQRKPMFADVMLGIPGKARMGPKAIIPYHIDLATGRMADLFTPWPWDNDRGAGYRGGLEDLL